MRNLLFCVFALVSIISRSQQAEIDSLKTAFRLAKEDTDKIISLSWLSVKYKNLGAYDSALRYARQAIDRANVFLQQNKQKEQSSTYKLIQKWNGRLYNNLGLINTRQGNYPESL